MEYLLPMDLRRISWIDIARGIGIILVIYGHAISGDGIRYLIYSFHMPLFFFLSGIVFHVRKYEHFWHFFVRTLKNIMYPYFLFALGSYVLWLFTINKTPVTFDGALRQLLGILYGSGTGGALGYNVVLWFLPTLFVTKVVFSLITKISVKNEFLIIVLFIFSLIGWFFFLFFPTTRLPFGTEISLTSIVFFGVGFLWSKFAKELNLIIRKYSILFLVFFISLCLFTATVNHEMFGYQLDLRLNLLNDYLLFYVASFSGIIAIVIISVLIGKNRLLEYLGRNSLVLFGWHLIVFAYFSMILKTIMTTNEIKNIQDLYLAPIYTILSIIVILLVQRELRIGLKKIKLNKFLSHSN